MEPVAKKESTELRDAKLSAKFYKDMAEARDVEIALLKKSNLKLEDQTSELQSKVDGLTAALRSRQVEIANLTRVNEEAHQRYKAIKKELKAAVAHREQDMVEADKRVKALEETHAKKYE